MKIKDFRTPGQLIKALLEKRGWTKRALSVVLGVGEATVTRLVGDKQPVDAKMALVLEEVFEIPAENFLTLQKDFDLAQARIVAHPDPGRATRARLYGDLPVGEMIKRGWLSAESVRDSANVEKELMRFFGANRIEDICNSSPTQPRKQPSTRKPRQRSSRGSTGFGKSQSTCSLGPILRRPLSQLSGN